MGFCFFVPWELFGLLDLELCRRGRVITITDLKEVLKAKTEEKEKQKGGEERSRRGESLYSWDCPVKRTVSRQQK